MHSMSVYCPRCYSRLKQRIRDTDSFGYVGLLHCDCGYSFQVPDDMKLYHLNCMGYETHKEAKLQLLKQFNNMIVKCKRM
jgi:hypothetical protein